MTSEKKIRKLLILCRLWYQRLNRTKVKYKGQSILNIVENMKHECIEKVVMDFSITWYVSKDDVMYAATHYRNGEIPNESAIRENRRFHQF